MIEDILTRPFVTAPPGRCRREDEFLPEKIPTNRSEEGKKPRTLQHFGPRMARHCDIRLAQRLKDPGDALGAVGAISLERIEITSVSRFPDDIDWLKAAESFQPDLATSDGEIERSDPGDPAVVCEETDFRTFSSRIRIKDDNARGVGPDGDFSAR